ncbi:MAG: hypothetical protein ACKV0T_03375 [Planctomycetales bacterium]
MHRSPRFWGAVSSVFVGLSWTAGQAHAALGPVWAQVKVDKGGGRSYIVESIVTVLLFGLALWTICKSSRRV